MPAFGAGNVPLHSSCSALHLRKWRLRETCLGRVFHTVLARVTGIVTRFVSAHVPISKGAVNKSRPPATTSRTLDE